jgi:hypothetical protein
MEKILPIAAMTTIAIGLVGIVAKVFSMVFDIPLLP